MSAYNLLFGVQPTARTVLVLLNWDPRDIPRFRDAFILERDGALFFAIRTRTGGDNRADYATEIETLTRHPWYVSDADEPADSTYCVFLFRSLPDLREHLIEAMEHQNPRIGDLGAMMEHALNASSAPTGLH